MLEKWLKLDWQ